MKTLEEPPPHVIFVLATTDPHKVLPTIRSRTQHLEFRLIGGDTLSTLLHDVKGAAGLAADEATIDAAVRLGRGSARDALSALDQLLATGSLIEAQPEFDGLFHAMVDVDAVGALRSLALLTQEGWDPEQLAESFAAEVRQVFLLQVAPEVADAVDSDRDRLSAWGSRLGLPRTVRILETIGKAMREMKSAPEKIVTLEVALVRLTRPELDSSLEALDERLTKLERAPARAPAPAPPPTAALRPIGSVEVTKSVSVPSTVTPEPAPTPASPPAPESVESSTDAPLTSAPLDFDDVRARFEQHVVPRTARSAQMLLKSAQLRSLDGNRLTIAVPSDEMRQSTDVIMPGLRSALEHEFKSALQVEWVVDRTLSSVTTARAPRPARAPSPDAAAEEGYPGDESVLVVESVADHLITEMFPGAEEIS